MGLAAVVYLNLKKVAANIPRDDLRVDRRTGEVYFRDDDVAHAYPGNTFKAVERRPGNVAELAQILAEVSIVTSSNSILRGKILKSFSHSGDVIGSDELDTLEQEINLIRTKPTAFAQQL